MGVLTIAGDRGIMGKSGESTIYRPAVYELLSSEITGNMLSLSKFHDLIEAVRETLLLRHILAQLCNAVDRCRVLVQTEQDPLLASRLWRSSVNLQIERIVSMVWSFIGEELDIVEHPGLSVYTLRWRECIGTKGKEIERQLSLPEDHLDFAQVLESMLHLNDTLIAIDLVVEVGLCDLIDSWSGKLSAAIQRLSA